MTVLFSVLGSRGVLEIVEWFGEVEGAARYVILGLSALLLSTMLTIWKGWKR